MYKEETSTVAMRISGGRGLGCYQILSRKMVGILDMGEERFDKRLEVGIDVH